jgi:hypothetical protein
VAAAAAAAVVVCIEKVVEGSSSFNGTQLHKAPRKQIKPWPCGGSSSSSSCLCLISVVGSNYEVKHLHNTAGKQQLTQRTCNSGKEKHRQQQHQQQRQRQCQYLATRSAPTQPQKTQQRTVFIHQAPQQCAEARFGSHRYSLHGTSKSLASFKARPNH